MVIADRPEGVSKYGQGRSEPPSEKIKDSFKGYVTLELDLGLFKQGGKKSKKIQIKFT